MNNSLVQLMIAVAAMMVVVKAVPINNTNTTPPPPASNIAVLRVTAIREVSGILQEITSLEKSTVSLCFIMLHTISVAI